MQRLSSIVFLGICSLFSTHALAQNVIRGPYLQLQTDNSISIHWRTDVATDSVVRFGPDSVTLNSTAGVPGLRTEHVVEVSGLTPQTQYFYSVGDGSGSLAGDASYFFHTAPVIGTPTPTRVWVIGDSGTAVTHPGQAIAVKDAYKTYAGSSPADFMIMLGDNAYNDGTDQEYQDTVFDVYPELFRQMPVWSTLGNHDGHTADSTNQTGPYYDIFEFPKAAEVGGYPSFTEAYYSFDYGDIHFVNLDSYDIDRSSNGVMMQWLESDLALNDKPWVIAIWHHPPYTKGSHDSDTESQLVDMRQNALPILEAWGVDLVMSGHSHSYERSYLLDGHYGISTTLDPVANVLDPGDGSESGDGVYEKPEIVAAENAGAVYAVAGSSGKVSNASLNHPAMVIGLVELGSMVIDIAGNRLDAVFIDDTGAVRDQFTLMKTPDIQPPLLGQVRVEDGTHVMVDYTERVDSVTATDSSNYGITGLAVSNAAILSGNKSVRLTTSAMTPGQAYTLTVNNVMDEAGNVIAANSQFAFEFNQQISLFFQDGLSPTPAYDGTADTYIREATATTNYGGDVTLQADGDEPSGLGTDMSILISWDISEIPASATVDSVNFHFNTLNLGGPYYCYALKRSWDQNQATWNQADSGSAWGLAGAQGGSDRDSLPLCTVNTASTGPLVVSLNAAGIALVQSWVAGTAVNHGFVIADAASTNGADFDSSESASAMNRPKLEVIYTVPVDPPNQLPVADFSYSCTFLGCNFTDASGDSDGSIASWSWTFGDGNGAATQNPTHAFASAGTYSVNLTVTDNEGGMDSDAQFVSVTAPPPPNAPGSLVATTWSASQINLNWSDNSSDESGFSVERSPNGTGSWIEVATPAANSTAWSDTGLAAGTTYFYRVFAFNANGNSADSNTGSDTTFTSPRTIQFSGRSWTVKSSGSPVGPGPNYFGSTADDVWVDGSGHLHMRMEFRDGVWHSSEVISEDVLGYGDYTFELGSRVDLLDPNIVVGLFTWDTSAPQFNYRELDIEFARWGNPLNDNSQYVVQPYDTVGNIHRWETTLTGNDSTHGFTWRPDRVEFSSYQGIPAGAAIQSWTYIGPDVPPEGTTSGNARINFWLMAGNAPINGQEAELLVKSFSHTPLPQNDPPVAGFSDACSILTCDFTDISSDSDGSIVSWAWDFGDSTGSSVQNPSHSFASDGTYTVRLTVTDNEGATDAVTRQITVSTPPLFVDVVAIADLPGAGSVSGSYVDTQTDGGGAQSILERPSGGKKNTRYSYLEHVWQFNLPANALATLHSNAWSGGSNDDQFQFSWSTDNISFSNIFVVSSTNPSSVQSFALPQGTSGPVYIRVRDTDQTAGNASLDTVFVDHLYIRAESGVGNPPTAPTGLAAVAASGSQINLQWTDNASDESGFRIERSTNGASFSEVGTAVVNATSFSDTGLNAGTTYWYRVLAWNASGDSAYSNISSATTDTPPPPQVPSPPSELTANATGATSVVLAWQDNSNNELDFEIERSLDGISFNFLALTVSNAQDFTDSGLSASTNYWYRVRARNATGNSAFSNVAAVTTDAQATINLSLSGHKNKGKNEVDLTWSGATTASVTIIRDGTVQISAPNTGFYTDNTGHKGSRSYTYQVCEVGGSACSAIESFAF